MLWFNRQASHEPMDSLCDIQRLTAVLSISETNLISYLSEVPSRQENTRIVSEHDHCISTSKHSIAEHSTSLQSSRCLNTRRNPPAERSNRDKWNKTTKLLHGCCTALASGSALNSVEGAFLNGGVREGVRS